MAELSAETASAFRALLADTIGQLEQFVRLLDQEHALLMASDAEALLTLAADKSAAMRRLQNAESTRALMLSRAGIASSREAVDAFVAGPAKATHAAWQHYLQLVERVRDMNAANGILVREQMRFNQQAMNALLSVNESGLYGADGQAAARPGGRHLGSV